MVFDIANVIRVECATKIQKDCDFVILDIEKGVIKVLK